ncbi:protein adenylyltransferase SelO [Nitrincola sp.]|uniref:protein adenylyltransferase SelO n=1 Tax=Nitrincola sp. TaxID=1926584 RepID=UPI003A947FE4
MVGMRTLDTLNFDNTYAGLPSHWFQRTQPKALKNAHLISFNPRVAAHLDLDPCQTHPQDLASYFGGQMALPGAEPLAMKYTGHQFGHYNPDLGDGRGLLLGEVVNSKGQRWDLHLKGAGQTAYSRFGDGRAVLRSSIREYLVSEAMYGLGIPSTDALCLVGSEEYTPRLGMEPCAMLLRVTPCHIRFGHFEWLYYSRRHDELKQLADYCLARFYPDCSSADQPYLAMFDQVMERTARLVAHWQTYGFVHGVLNTDNMSILGETFDYGPYTFLDSYEPDHVANKNDDGGRYAFFRQPAIVHWNLACLAQALLPLISREALEAKLESFPAKVAQYQLSRQKARLGLQTEQAGDAELVSQLWQLFEQQKTDITLFFSALTELTTDELRADALQAFTQSNTADWAQWFQTYQQRVTQEHASGPIRHQQMRSVNPYYLLRNYMAEEAIREATQGDYRLVNQLLPILRHPCEQHAAAERFMASPPDWAAAICLTCSS